MKAKLYIVAENTCIRVIIKGYKSFTLAGLFIL
jgi:hypothetical protein